MSADAAGRSACATSSHPNSREKSRLVAAMNVHAITSILTFDVDDFKRYPGIQVLHPQDIISQS